MKRQQQRFKRFNPLLILGGSFLPLLIPLALTPPAQSQDVELDVGIVQRFGDEKTDKMVISSTDGDLLKLRFLAGNMQPQTVQTDKVTLEMTAQPLSQPQLQERIVLSDHATFETAEDSAKQWEKKGIAVEVTQPDRWQVWAKRGVYKTPLLRRRLLESLQAQGETSPYLESEVVTEVQRLSFVVNGYRYSRQRLDISSNKNLFRVDVENDDQPPRLYAGNLKMQPNSYGNYTLVNQVPLETYLRGVVPHEIGSGAPFAAAQAQTIIARTYALRNLRRFKADGYQLCANTHCQVYWGLTGTSDRSDSAIASTRGLVLTYNNELVDALYSSTTGGVTASFSDIWNGEERPYLQAVVDSPQVIWDISNKSLADEATFRQFISLKDGFNEAGRSVFRWNKSSNIDQLSADLNRYLKRIKHPLVGFNKIQKMEVTKRSPSGRILEMTVNTDKGVVKLYKTEVRSAFGPPRSTLFYIDPIYGANQQLKGYAFVGGGFGHGVGLSQYGSYNLANLGWSPELILSFYYPGTEIKSLDTSIVFYDGD